MHNFLESDKFQKKYNLIHPQKNVAVDLQWSLTERRITRFFPVDFQHLQQNSQKISFLNSEILQFSSEDMVLYLCFHGSKHCWSELKWIVDLAEFITANRDINWEIVNQRSQQWKISRMLSLGLFLVNDLFGVDTREKYR
ncbi:MAG: nucleotidyltransferase family protein [Hydrococcus sp. SU_1_0]|nr:nucleotidyltransferase family protein [Hydrococcus sp. SU_1_0]